MLERDLRQTLPSPMDQANMPGELSITIEDTQSEAVDNLLAAMRHVFANGDAQFVSFMIGPHPVLDYYAVRDQLDKLQFWTQILKSPVVLDQLPWLNTIYIDQTKVQFEPLSAYYLDGDLAQTLMKGGAYRRFPGTADEAMILGRQFCSDVFDNRYDELILRKSNDAWADWFMHAPWDHTWLGLDRRVRRLWLLCSTDTD